MFRKPYIHEPSEGISFDPDERMTEGSHAHECDINFIMKKYQSQGVLTHVNNRPALYDDVPEMDFHQAMDAIIEMQEQFMELPSVARKYFGNDPHNYYEALKNGADLEAIMSGELERMFPDSDSADSDNVPAEPAGDSEIDSSDDN